ncbi:MAG: oligopeptidase A [Chromatiales bacterium]
MNDDPLLEDALLPSFSRIDIAHIEPTLDRLLSGIVANTDDLLRGNAEPSWQKTLEPIEDLDDRLNRMWSPVSHLHNVADNDALRAVYSACLPKLTRYFAEKYQNEALYRAFRHVRDGAKYTQLGAAQRMIIDNALRDFRLAGIELDSSGRERVRQIRQELSRLQTSFEENVLDATQAWTKLVAHAEVLQGLPESALALARQAAERRGKTGWMLTLEFPSYRPVMAYCANRPLREEMYTAYVTRASDQGPHAGQWDNSPIMDEILRLRAELARLLGFDNFANYSLATKMAKSSRQVLDFLNDLVRRARPCAQRELEELRAFAADRHGVRTLQAWDIRYYSEKLREEKYAVSQEMLRPYFPVPRVLDGLFAVVRRLYGIRIAPRGNVDVWHPDVLFFEISDEAGELRGMFYLDLYARPHKRGGAWMDECVTRRRRPDGSVQIPVAYLTCNFTPPLGSDPALLTHDEVLTLFHEFGHGLHHMLTRVDHPSVAGINGVAWDAVELPSQFMENWCWERDALDLIARHYRSAEPLDPRLLERLRAARNFQSGMQMVRQLEFAIFDFRLHLDYDPGADRTVQAVVDEVRREVAVVQPPAFNRFQHVFSHIFAGGYAAGYYSYKWAEVLSADAYSKFEERGIFDTATGREFLHCVLETGGSADALELFVRFRGREPSPEALLRHSGIA